MTKLKAPDLDAEFNGNQFAVARFLIDGFKVSIHHVFYKNKLVKSFYVNDLLKGAWMVDRDCEENKRFAYAYSRCVHSKRFREELLKVYRGAKKKQKRKELEEARIEIRNFHTSVKVKTIIRQWVGREINKSVELVDGDGNVLFKYK